MSTTETQPVIKKVPALINGQWRELDSARFEKVYNPSTGKIIAHTPLCSADDVSDVVQVAKDALAGWSQTPAVERARTMFRLRSLIETNFEELAALITREHGKTLASRRTLLLQLRVRRSTPQRSPRPV